VSALLRRRLIGQRLVGTALDRPAEVVRWLGAVQAQDYRGALWGIGQRTRGASEAEVERALADRQLVRSWPMRRTLHIVPAADLRWMLRHLASRAVRGMAGRHRSMGLRPEDFTRAGRLLEKALAGGRQMTRAEIYQLFARGRVSTEGQRGIHLIAFLAMTGLLCFGPHRGKHPTFVLLDEWLAPSPVLDREPALAELARRYLASHGPATAADLAWWAGLSLGEARAAIALAGPQADKQVPRRAGASAHLLPPWDEYTVAYKDRSAIVDPAIADATRGGIFAPVVVLDGRVAGTWRQKRGRLAIDIDAELIAPPSTGQARALAAAAERLGAFVGLSARLNTSVRRAAAGARRRAPRS